MTSYRCLNREVSSGNGVTFAVEGHGIPEIVKHVALALFRHVRLLHQESLPVPREVEELAALLMRLASIRQEPPTLTVEQTTAHPVPMGNPDRLLVSKCEAAERLGVSVRTVERLVATGRLRQVHVERLARFRVSDLKAYVDALTDNPEPTESSPDRHVAHD
jgi:excisionase family DNA binding protein